MTDRPQKVLDIPAALSTLFRSMSSTSFTYQREEIQHGNCILNGSVGPLELNNVHKSIQRQVVVVFSVPLGWLSVVKEKG
jgi:hypothetical protein